MLQELSFFWDCVVLEFPGRSWQWLRKRLDNKNYSTAKSTKVILLGQTILVVVWNGIKTSSFLYNWGLSVNISLNYFTLAVNYTYFVYRMSSLYNQIVLLSFNHHCRLYIFRIHGMALVLLSPTDFQGIHVIKYIVLVPVVHKRKPLRFCHC